MALKGRLEKPPVLIFPDVKKPLVLCTDTSE